MRDKKITTFDAQHQASKSVFVYETYRQILQQLFDLHGFRGNCMSCSGLPFLKEVGGGEQLKASWKLPTGKNVRGRRGQE